MASTFLERNKKKSLLALLLLFLRERKALSLLLLLVVMASMAVGPGGWLAAKFGFDTARWGFGKGEGTLAALTRTLREVRARGAAGAGWSSFFGPGRASRSGPGAGSLDYVKGRRADLESGASTIQGVEEPSRRAGAVALTEEDLGGEREGFVKSAFAGGFADGFLGRSGAGALSGGAYAGRAFFSGDRRAEVPGSLDRERHVLDGAPLPATPSSRVGGAARGALSAIRAHIIDARARRGAALARRMGEQRGFAHLAEQHAFSRKAAETCMGPGCPREVAATFTGVVYDGLHIRGANADILTATELGDVDTNVPNVDDLGDTIRDLDEWQQKCEDAQNEHGPVIQDLLAQYQPMAQEVQQKCKGSCAKKGKCKKAMAKLKELQAQIEQHNAEIEKACTR